MITFNSFSLFLILITFVGCLQLCPKNKFWSIKLKACKNCSQCAFKECHRCYEKSPQYKQHSREIAVKRRELASGACASDSKCITCISTSDCGTCVNGYAPNSSGTCTSCSSTCLTCTAPSNAAACATCRVNYYLNDAFNCVICSSAFGADCKECIKFGCDICYTGTPIAGNPGCDTSTPPPPPTPSTCSANCLNCSSPTVCLSCDQNYQLQADACVSVAPPPNSQSQPVLGSVSPLGKSIKAMCVALAVLSWGTFFIAIPSIKLAGLEQLFVMQFAWINLAFLPSPYPPTYAAASPLKYSSGYAVANGDLSLEMNRNYQPEHFTIDTRHFTNNFNLVLILYLFPLLMAVIFKVLSKTENYKEKAVERMEFWIEMTMYGVMANLVGLTIYSCVFFTGGESGHPASIFVILLSLTITVCTLIFFFFYPDPFQRFRYSFKPSTLSFSHYYIHTANLILVVALVAGAPSAPWAPCIPLAILATYTLLFRPYKVLIENFRSFFFLLVMIITAVIRTVLCSSSNEWRMSQTPVILLVILVFVLLLLCTIWAYFEVLRYILCERRVKDERKKQLDYALFQDSQMMKQVCNKQNMSKIMSLNPLTEFNTSYSLRKDSAKDSYATDSKNNNKDEIKLQKPTQVKEVKPRFRQYRATDSLDFPAGNSVGEAPINFPVNKVNTDQQQCDIGLIADKPKRRHQEPVDINANEEIVEKQNQKEKLLKEQPLVIAEDQLCEFQLKNIKSNTKAEEGQAGNIRNRDATNYEQPLSPKRKQLYKILKSQLKFFELKNAEELSKPNDQNLLNAYHNI